MNHLEPAEIEQFVDGELDAAASAAVREHLQVCAACRGYSERLETYGRLLRSPDAHAGAAADTDEFVTAVMQRIAESPAHLAASKEGPAPNGSKRTRPLFLACRDYLLPAFGAAFAIVIIIVRPLAPQSATSTGSDQTHSSIPASVTTRELLLDGLGDNDSSGPFSFSELLTLEGQ